MINKIENILLGIAGACIVSLCALITITVLTRSFFGFGVPDDVIIVKELMIGAIVLPLAAVSSARAHIAIEFLYNRFSPKVQTWLIAFASMFALIALFPITYAAFLKLAHVLEVDAYFFGHLSLPKWPGNLAFFVGMAFFCLRMALLFLQDLKAALAFNSASAPQNNKV